MSYLSENLKILIWQTKSEYSKQSYSEYMDAIAQKCHISPERFRDILKDKAVISGYEETNIRDFFESLGYDAYAISYDYLFSDIVERSKDELVDKNIQYLLGSIKHGQNKVFTDAIGVNASTVTRWKQGKTKPDRYALNQIAKYYGFPDASFLQTSFLFLDLDPVSTQQKKDECKKLIDNMSKEDFEALFPALRKLLG